MSKPPAPTCKMCSNIVTNWNSTKKKWSGYCSVKCRASDSELKEIRKQTNIKRHGVPFYTQSKKMREQSKQTCLEKYGTENPQQNKIIRQKFTQTMKGRYGVEYSGQSEELTQKRKETCLVKYGVDSFAKTEEFKKKFQSTMQEKYGVNYSGESKELTQKRKETCLEKYGVDSFAKTEEFLSKMKATNLLRYNVDYHQLSDIGKHQRLITTIKKYGVPHHWKNIGIRKKIAQTNIKRFGVEHPIKCDYIQDKIRTTNFNNHGVHHLSQLHMKEVLHLLHDYKWLVDQYITQNKTATQIANELNITQTTLCRYLHFHEIQIRYSFWSSYKSIQWLEQLMSQEGLYIQHALNGGEYRIPGTRYKADGYCSETNTIYEFHGDYWHGNPDVYRANEINKVTGKTMGELYQRTIKKERKICELGYNLTIVWERDWDALYLT